VAVGVPPAFLPGIPGELDEAVALFGRRAVDLQHVAHVTRGHRNAPGLYPADLRSRALQALCDFLASQLRCPPESSQSQRKPAPPYCRALRTCHVFTSRPLPDG